MADQPDNSLSPRQAFADAPEAMRVLIEYEPQSIWDQDTATLPATLQLLRRHVREFASNELYPRALAADLSPHDAGEEEAVLTKAFQAGLFSNFVPAPIHEGASDNEAGGGGVVSRREAGERISLDEFPIAWSASIRSEELAAGCGGWALMLAAHALGSTPLVLSGDTDAMKRVFAKAKLKGRAGRPYLLAYAITEPAAGSDAEQTAGAATAKPGTIARRTDGGWLLNGRKVFTSGGDLADAVMTFAALEESDGGRGNHSGGLDSWTCFLVERDTPGFTRVRNESKMGQRASAATELEFCDAFVPDENIIGGLRQGWALNRASLNYSRIPVAAIALGIARGAMEAAIEFAHEFTIGGRRLIDNQETQLQVAQMIADTSSMRATIWDLARRPIPTQATASIAKVSCSDTALKVCETAMEVLSNHAVLHRHRVEKALRDVRLTQIYEGTNEINRLAIIEDLRDSLAPAAGGKLGQ